MTFQHALIVSRDERTLAAHADCIPLPVQPQVGVRCRHCGGITHMRMTCESKTRKSGWEFIERTYYCGFCGKRTTRAGGGPIPIIPLPVQPKDMNRIDEKYTLRGYRSLDARMGTDFNQQEE